MAGVVGDGSFGKGTVYGMEHRSKIEERNQKSSFSSWSCEPMVGDVH